MDHFPPTPIAGLEGLFRRIRESVFSRIQEQQQPEQQPEGQIEVANPHPDQSQRESSTAERSALDEQDSHLNDLNGNREIEETQPESSRGRTLERAPAATTPVTQDLHWSQIEPIDDSPAEPSPVARPTSPHTIHSPVPSVPFVSTSPTPGVSTNPPDVSMYTPWYHPHTYDAGDPRRTLTPFEIRRIATMRELSRQLQHQWQDWADFNNTNIRHIPLETFIVVLDYLLGEREARQVMGRSAPPQSMDGFHLYTIQAINSADTSNPTGAPNNSTASPSSIAGPVSSAGPPAVANETSRAAETSEESTSPRQPDSIEMRITLQPRQTEPRGQLPNPGLHYHPNPRQRDQGNTRDSLSQTSSGESSQGSLTTQAPSPRPIFPLRRRLVYSESTNDDSSGPANAGSSDAGPSNTGFFDLAPPGAGFSSTDVDLEAQTRRPRRPRPGLPQIDGISETEPVLPEENPHQEAPSSPITAHRPSPVPPPSPPSPPPPPPTPLTFWGCLAIVCIKC
ncbi:hypothetical protein F4781DRAFT_436531 [Annulohypoxylon bovei var. microspora]|nr:hypothetical protein F4781DRAFT_436531 [Annulohypoxylon bovei var. microspora]